MTISYLLILPWIPAWTFPFSCFRVNGAPEGTWIWAATSKAELSWESFRIKDQRFSCTSHYSIKWSLGWQIISPGITYGYCYKCLNICMLNNSWPRRYLWSTITSVSYLSQQHYDTKNCWRLHQVLINLNTWNLLEYSQ